MIPHEPLDHKKTCTYAVPMRKYIKVPNVRGLQYREHATRKHAGRADRYYLVRWSRSGKVVSEALGWASEGWTINKASGAMGELQQNYKRGIKPGTFAEARALEEQRQQTEAVEHAKAQAGRLTFRQFFDDHYVPKAQKRKRTWRDDVLRAEKRIHPSIGDLPLDMVNPDCIERLREDLYEDGLSDATVKHVLAVIRRVFNVAALTTVEGIPVFTGESPMAHVEMPTVTNRRERFLTYDEAEQVLNACITRRENTNNAMHAQGWQDVHDSVILALYAGLRLGEVQRLEWGDINFFAGIITIKNEKDRKPGGSVPMNSIVRDMLTRRNKQRDKRQKLVVPPMWGQVKDISHTFSELVNELGLNDDATSNLQRIVFHSLRHTFASWMAMNGVDLNRIRKLMRHKTLTMTQRYAHLLPDATQDAVEALCRPRTDKE